MKIRKITSLGVDYLDDVGNLASVNFQECHKNWMAYRKRKEGLSELQVASLASRDKIIGQREIRGSVCYIEFFTRPFVRFEFRSPEEQKQYAQLRDAIWEAGWQTNDLG
jgi:hypothetical protein